MREAEILLGIGHCTHGHISSDGKENKKWWTTLGERVSSFFPRVFLICDFGIIFSSWNMLEMTSPEVVKVGGFESPEFDEKKKLCQNMTLLIYPELLFIHIFSCYTLQCSGFTPASILRDYACWGYGVLGVRPRWATCKASDLATVLS